MPNAPPVTAPRDRHGLASDQEQYRRYANGGTGYSSGESAENCLPEPLKCRGFVGDLLQPGNREVVDVASGALDMITLLVPAVFEHAAGHSGHRNRTLGNVNAGSRRPVTICRWLGRPLLAELLPPLPELDDDEELERSPEDPDEPDVPDDDPENHDPDQPPLPRKPNHPVRKMILNLPLRTTPATSPSV